ncbi:MAG TPA: serine hydrolase domain-containing protein [Chitinophagaceae bacterium]
MSHKVSLICMKVTSITAFLLFFQPLFAQNKWAELDQELQAKQKLLGTNVVAMIWTDTLVYKKEMGDFNTKTQAPIASCSKWLTAALIMQLVDEGKVSLDDKVGRWIPEFARYGKSYITLRDCLSHMTGIEDEGGLLKKLFQRKKFDSLEDEVNSFASREIRANPATDFWYGNIGLNIAGRIAEVATKKKFDILIKQKLFNPLGMRKTSFSTIDASAVNPSGGAISTAEDYMKFLVMLLNKGKYNGVQVISESSVDLMMKIYATSDKVKYAPKSAEGYGYAFGSWVVDVVLGDISFPGKKITPLVPPPSEDGLSQKKQVATAFASPGLFGTWPMIDYCRGYAYLVFVKNFLGEERADVHRELKKIIDKQIPSTCL